MSSRSDCRTSSSVLTSTSVFLRRKAEPVPLEFRRTWRTAEGEADAEALMVGVVDDEGGDACGGGGDIGELALRDGLEVGGALELAAIVGAEAESESTVGLAGDAGTDWSVVRSGEELDAWAVGDESDDDEDDSELDDCSEAEAEAARASLRSALRSSTGDCTIDMTASRISSSDCSRDRKRTRLNSSHT